ncbi:hypothetical protein HELRODRAFT_175979 [Helobdella robusta]|uniref:Protein amnionless n=1 Tax=Helobdella robusta TaxID=6412 RepID=T1F9Z7_HELRO|nr:hypothetical protein HELRODRAFT_175979 [Helobdella robusta]ESO00158.1 hypothetical protein HELRODRAFT_175979 [Helobdella robusta]
MEYDNFENATHFTHAQRVPCKNSAIVLSYSTDFNFKIEPRAVTQVKFIILVESVKYFKSENEFFGFSRNDMSSERFDVPASSIFKISGGDTIDEMFCESDNQRFRQICSYVQCPSLLHCNNPFKPRDHCCQVCGLKVDVHLHEKYSKIEIYHKIFDRHLSIPKMVSTMVADGNATDFEFVAADETDDGSALNAIQETEKALNEVLDGFRKLNPGYTITTNSIMTSSGESLGRKVWLFASGCERFVLQAHQPVPLY